MEIEFITAIASGGPTAVLAYLVYKVDQRLSQFDNKLEAVLMTLVQIAKRKI